MKKSLAAALAGAAGLIAAGLVVLGGPAHATPEDQAPEPVCAVWKARGATGAYPGVTFGGKPAGTVITKSSAKLVKPSATDADQPGVEFAARNVKIQAEGDLIVSVNYETSDGASVAAGAVRLFGYQAKDANTLTVAPDWSDVAEAESGNLLFTVPAGKKLGTVGLVYDASNNTRGTVTFTGMTIGDRPVSFTKCPKPTPSATSVSPSTSASATPSTSASATPSATVTTVPGAVTTDPPAAGPSLPVTGPGVGIIVAGGAVLLGIGFVVLFATRSRRLKTEA